jgi:predicted metal-dependent phosphoesterase TrpH
VSSFTLKKNKQFSSADIHIHSSASDGLPDFTEILDYVENFTDLDLIAITDHDIFESSIRAREIAAKKNLRVNVVPGVEISTLEGHILALFLETPVASHKPLADTIESVHKKAGICIIPHPMNWLVGGISQKNLLQVECHKNPKVYIDGFETINQFVVGPLYRKKADKLTNELSLAELGASDAHFLEAIGSGVTIYPGRTEDDLKNAILEKKTISKKIFDLPLHTFWLYNSLPLLKNKVKKIY